MVATCPLKDIYRLCEKHSDCYFSCLTNGALIDNDMAREIGRVGNFVPAFSIAEFVEVTHLLYGGGIYLETMKLWKS